MGYDLHITRKKFWADEDGATITPEEWLTVVRDDPELRFAGEEHSPYFALWSGPSSYPEPWIDYFEGGLYSKNPDGPLINKMTRIATTLAAQVQGDEGEVYPLEADYRNYGVSQGEEIPSSSDKRFARKAGKQWWQFWL